MRGKLIMVSGSWLTAWKPTSWLELDGHRRLAQRDHGVFDGAGGIERLVFGGDADAGGAQVGPEL